MTEWQEVDVLTNSIRIHYYRAQGKGADSGKTVVLCHGNSDQGRQYGPLARELREDYDVIMVDARYHGYSEAPRWDEEPDSMAHDLAGLIDALKLERPVAGGHSMGAGYVFRAAALYPDMLRAIMLEDPGWRDHFPQRPLAQRQAEMDRYRTATVEELRAEWQAKHPHWTDEMLDLMAETKKLMSPESIRRQWVTVDWRETLRQVRCPILLFTGDVALGALVSEDAVQMAKEMAPTLEHVHTPGVGHLIRYDSPEPYTSATKEFLARVFGPV
jgi:N-formylmaleamate deformylase